MNCPVTAEDVDNAEKIYGPDIGTRKGKTTRKKPTPVKRDEIEAPKELIEKNQDITLCMDIMFINGMPMLTTIDRAIRFRSMVPLKTRTHEDMYKGIDHILRNYNKAGFQIKTVNCDREFKGLMDPIKDKLDADMNYMSTDEHVPEAERNNRTIGERIRATYHNLPYMKIPRVMLRHLGMVAQQQLNLFPAKGGISEYLSPHMIMSKKNIDYNKHCQFTFGTYVQAIQENNPKNTQAPRTIDAIYLRLLKNTQGGHEVMNLATGAVITRHRVWEQPATEMVIKAVEQMAERQGIETLKLTGRHGTRLVPTTWTPGVDVNDDGNDAEKWGEREPATAGVFRVFWTY